MVPANCAKCHSTTGMLDFLGADGSEAGKVDQPAPIGTTVTCTACHNDATAAMSAVTFPSGVEITDLGSSAICMQCHQGRSSMVQVDAQIEKFQATDLDAVVAPIKEGDKETAFGFINIHYYAAASTLYGGKVMGGYQYEGQVYDSKNDHIPGYDTCVSCHDSHSLEVKVESCAFCHEGVTDTESLKAIRMLSSASDYDGDGDVEEGIAAEMQGLQEAALTAIQSYAKEVAKVGLVYDSATYPYWLADADGDGAADTGDNGPVRYASWTPRLLKAAYNYQVSLKDPGAYAHNPKYIIELLYDSTADLNTVITEKVDMSNMVRDDAGHFRGNSEAFRHWDADNFEVPGSCARCHTGTGLPQFVKEGSNITNPASNGFTCYTCHNDAEWPSLYTIDAVTLPSGASITFGEGNPSNTCLECHQGRESKVSVDRAIKDLEPDTASDKIRFRNVHYFAAGATLFGTDAKGMYEYNGKEYLGAFAHVPSFATCAECHDVHKLTVNKEACQGCHQVDDPALIRGASSTADFDGDGDVTEGISSELQTYSDALYAAIQDYAKNVAGTPILYNPVAYPYYFVDADENGEADMGENGPMGYNAWTPRLLQAAYNYQYIQKDPGAFAHNGKYVLQVLYDSLADLGTKVTVDLTGFVRP
ncbi:MAG: cytochrome c3 family protein [Anaerolineae bacterium]|nr:cytochrome c3 family protein [Anaerolineae bacterium]